MKIAVVTTTYNRPGHFRLFLEALAGQTRPPDEVLVSDDGSDEDAWDEMRAAADASGLPVKWARQSHEGYRLAAARNAAFRLCQSEYAVCADCDMALLPDALEIHERLAARGCVVIANRALLDEDWAGRLLGAAPPVPAALWEDAWAAADKAELLDAERLYRKHAALRRWHLARPHKPKVIGCHFGVWMDDVRRVNGFDENFTGWGYEDDDFGRRLYLAGVKPRSGILEARAMHVWHPSLAPPSGGRHRDRPNRAYFYRRGLKARCENGLAK
ncbi:MAG: glycosyltransferase [Kiritimatiellae bacterium]|nr:glycosyltransferase [Kiritimatiellia bacterium]